MTLYITADVYDSVELIKHYIHMKGKVCSTIQPVVGTNIMFNPSVIKQETQRGRAMLHVIEQFAESLEVIRNSTI